MEIVEKDVENGFQFVKKASVESIISLNFNQTMIKAGKNSL